MRYEPVTAAALILCVESIEEELASCVGSGYNARITYHVGDDGYRVYDHGVRVVATSDVEVAADAYNAIKLREATR